MAPVCERNEPRLAPVDSAFGRDTMRAAMSQAEYSNVTVVAKANVYFDGKVVSHTIKLEGGAKKTLGLIYAGEFHFGTDAPERMDITAGKCEVRIDGETSWKTYEGGTFFKVPGKSGFDIKVASGIAEYVCSFE
jgi:uncharacterized protein YaiE (UPF0345 family)